MSGSEYVLTLFVLLAYKSLIIIAGLVIIYLGYCFLITAYEKAEKENDKEAAPKQNKVIWTGAIFASFGAGILISLIFWHGIDRDIKKAHKFSSEQNRHLKETKSISEKIIEQEKDCKK